MHNTSNDHQRASHDLETYVLQTNGLSVGYKHKKQHLPILSDVNVGLRKGQLVCFMGQNGIGKTTLLRTLSGLQPPLGGQVTINGKPLGQYDRMAMAKTVSMVLTDRFVAGDLSAGELVAMGRYPYTPWHMAMGAEDQRMVAKAIAETQIAPFADRPLHTLSDGQRQKALIARALAQDGQVMILDEPTAHLDLNNRVAVMALLKRLAHDTQKAILMATHELDLALQMADWFWLARTGAPLAQGTPEDLVLDGTLDAAFPLKGYDLKTGKIIPDGHRGHSVWVSGEGHVLLWTKNALNRAGYSIASDDGQEGLARIWACEGHLWRIVHGQTTHTEKSIQGLLAYLDYVL